jgi:exodeoxyribonuclease-3
VKTATFTINNVLRRLPNLLAWLQTANPDVVGLQELKAVDELFPSANWSGRDLDTRGVTQDS